MKIHSIFHHKQMPPAFVKWLKSLWYFCTFGYQVSIIAILFTYLVKLQFIIPSLPFLKYRLTAFRL
jgi:hypothetical protein